MTGLFWYPGLHLACAAMGCAIIVAFWTEHGERAEPRVPVARRQA